MGLSLARCSVNIDALQRTIVVADVRFTAFTQLRFDVTNKLRCYCEIYITHHVQVSSQQDADDLIYWRTLDVFQMQRSQQHIDPPKAVFDKQFWGWASARGPESSETIGM